MLMSAGPAVACQPSLFCHSRARLPREESGISEACKRDRDASRAAANARENDRTARTRVVELSGFGRQSRLNVFCTDPRVMLVGVEPAATRWWNEVTTWLVKRLLLPISNGC
jgi:hypothetical protein